MLQQTLTFVALCVKSDNYMRCNIRMLHERKRIVRTQQTEQKYNTLGGDASRVAIFLAKNVGSCYTSRATIFSAKIVGSCDAGHIAIFYAKIVGSCDAGRVTSYNKMYIQMNDSR